MCRLTVEGHRRRPLHARARDRDLYFFNRPATTEIYTLSLHDALPISLAFPRTGATSFCAAAMPLDRLTPTATATTRRLGRSEEHTSELQSQSNLVCRLLLEKKKVGFDVMTPDERAALTTKLRGVVAGR